MMALPQFMFDPIEPRLTAWEHVKELWTNWRAETMARKQEAARVMTAREKTQAALNAYNSVGNRRDGTATIKRDRLTRCRTDQLRAENACGSAG